MSSSRKNLKKTTEKPEPAECPGWFDRMGFLWLRIDRYINDILGLALISVGLTTLLGLFGLTAGKVMVVWTWLIRRWMGWGGFLFALVLILIGVIILFRQQLVLKKISLGKVLALEGLFFCLITLFSLSGGRSVVRANQGLDGGLIGWGLATILDNILPQPLVALFLILLSFLFTLSGFGISNWLAKQIEFWLDSPPKGPTTSSEGVYSSTPNWEGKIIADENLNVNATQVDKNNEEYDRTLGLPALHLLLPEKSSNPDEENIHSMGEIIEQTLREFGIPVRVVGFRVGPTVTQFAIEPGFIEKEAPDGKKVKQKIRVSQISALSRDLALSLSAERLRIQAPVPGHSFVGIEVPNRKVTVVRLRSILESEQFKTLDTRLALALGRDVSGQPVVADLTRMPHLLIAGTTGSGKSVCIAALAVCLAMTNSPADLRLAMMDPKMVELIRFNGLPHLLGKVETDVDRMLGMLSWALVEMDSRYKLLEQARTRDIDGYNKKAVRRGVNSLPRIVIMIDELADLMMSAPDQTEHTLVRLAQMARATGIHLVVATQRPSTDVVTGLIKANFPSRISFNVASSIDSRVILDSTGAETLMGRGDMLFLNPEVGIPMRAQGVMVTDHEIQRVINFWQNSLSEVESESPWEELVKQNEGDGPDDLLKQAVTIVKETQRASASLLQRRLHVGYPRAARLIDEMETLGVVGPAQGGGREREVLWSKDDADINTDSGAADEE